jgi:myo-inositol 2-dehydrogenase / D-chiro-inositol 1-dehydrogenase
MTDERSAAASTRREFLQTATATAAGTALAANLALLGNVHAAGNDVIKVGLIGCGGRGTGAAANCANSAPNVKIVALGDAFKDRLEGCRKSLQDLGDKVDIKDDHCFVGLDAYEKVLASGIDLVILATPPGFRPIHIAAAVKAGKHIFAEKPVAVDGPGIRKCLAAYEDANKKKLCIVTGTQRRHQTGYLETMKRIHGGDLGTITSGRCYWNQGPIWVKPRQQSQSDLDYQMRNWYYFVWLCGDHIVEQHVHNLDVINWATKAHPLRAVGMGGRQVRTGEEYGHVFDHFAIDYEYPGGVHVMSMARQIPGTKGNVSEALTGTKGFCQVNAYSIRDDRNQQVWRFPGKDNAPYVQEHTDLIEAIRSGKHVNELQQVAESTLTAIMGRMAAYTGVEVSWDKALNSEEDTMPAKLAWDMKLDVPPVAVPGKTKLI